MMAKAGIGRRPMAATMAALVIATIGCGGEAKRSTGPTHIALPTLRASTGAYAAGSVATFATLPDATRLGPVPCDDPGGDLADDGRYQVSGSWQVPLPPGRHRATFRQLREDWQARAIEITEYRELPDGVKVSLAGRDPAAGFSLSLTSTQPPDAVALLVVSSCVISPDGRYPG
ncbi:hypothetical protein O7626_22545 [Micromonospora sp. WMMD1102]|uniref:hypothetical protein n=1 Tax=Micromonospora sp. WMMD1102 TaxID=3016105 RepID=UPI0024152332|nr:hypothetical protein [Micromonospora sp. WMMD1102]MDG4788669.1 hypothetical protein [Micromonospora sp. WMMD1102]